MPPTIRPNLLIIGAAKAGTTSLWHLLDQHPSVYLCPEKEPWFFSHHWRRGWAWYEAQFPGYRGEPVLGEASTSYTMAGRYPGVAERIHAALPNAKLIYIVRHPLRQIESLWLELRKVSGAGVPHDFNQAVRTLPMLTDTCRYWRQIGLYRRLYADSQILPLFFEDLVRSPATVAARCFEFLGVPAPAAPLDAEPQNVAATQTVDSPLASRLRHAPGLQALADCAPTFFLDAAKRMLKRPIQGRPTWDARLRAEVAASIAEDTAAFLAYAGRPATFYDLGLPVARAAA